MEQHFIERRFKAIDERQADTERTLDNHTAVLQEISEQSDRHTQAFQRVETLLNAHTESISALQADVTSVKATQSDHGELLKSMATKEDISAINAIQAEHSERFDKIEVLLRQILERQGGAS